MREKDFLLSYIEKAVCTSVSGYNHVRAQIEKTTWGKIIIHTTVLYGGVILK